MLALPPASAKEDWKMETRSVCLSFRFLSGATTQVGRAVAMIGSALGTQPKASAAHGKLDLVTALDMEREQENHILGAVVCSLLLSDLRSLSFSASRRLAWMAGLAYIYRS
jgi:hypothetical protein